MRSWEDLQNRENCMYTIGRAFQMALVKLCLDALHLGAYGLHPVLKVGSTLLLLVVPLLPLLAVWEQAEMGLAVRILHAFYLYM